MNVCLGERVGLVHAFEHMRLLHCNFGSVKELGCFEKKFAPMVLRWPSTKLLKIIQDCRKTDYYGKPSVCLSVRLSGSVINEQKLRFDIPLFIKVLQFRQHYLQISL